MSYPKYYRCSKCGQYIAKVRNAVELSHSMCTGSVSYRTSGICGGSFSIEMTEEEYNAQLRVGRKKKKK